MLQKAADEKLPAVEGGIPRTTEVIAQPNRWRPAQRDLIDTRDYRRHYYISIMPDMDLMSLTQFGAVGRAGSRRARLPERTHMKNGQSRYVARIGTGSLFYMFMNKEVKQTADFKNLKIRVSPTHIPFTKALGAENHSDAALDILHRHRARHG
jgi:hypothetical protein